MRRAQQRARVARALKTAVLGGILAASALVIPDSTVASTEVTLVKIDRAQGIDLEPDVIWILAVGSDARPGEDMLRTRGDALQLIGINVRTHAATSVGVPRDSYVSIPGVGSNRINAALYYGGPELLGRTVGELVGVQPEYVFVTRFPFFEDMVDDIGGIDVRNPTPFSDENLKPNGFKAGKLHLNGYSAMAFARIRHNLPAGDFDRSANQQRVLRGIQSTVRNKADQPGFVERGVLTVMKHLHTDLPPSELFKLAQAIVQIDPTKVTGCVVQGGIGNVGGASVVLPYVDQARSYGDQARKDATIERC